jgi:glycosyltransferase involved in cell wall biosynthesis
VVAVAARLRGRRTILLQEHSGRVGTRLSAWERYYRRLVTVVVHGVVANTDAAYAELAETLGVDEAKLFRATLLVPPERRVLSADPPHVSHPARRPLFLFAGRLIRSKNVSGLLDAAIALRARNFEFEVWIAGDGPQREALEAKARALTDSGVVRFLGSFPSTAMGVLYEQADVFVMPSFMEYRSIAVLEAMRFGKAVIDSVYDGNVGDCVRDQLTGFAFDPYTAGALEAAMEEMIIDDDARRELGHRAATAMQSLTPRTAAMALNEIIEAVQR